MAKVVAVHQPNFFPWLGYFDKIARSDVFIFLEDVQYPKTGGGTWLNRVKLLIAGEARWVTAAIDRNYHGFRNINEMNFLSTEPWRRKLLKSIEMNYRKHPFYAETMQVVEPLIIKEDSNIASYNVYAIRVLTDTLGLNTNKFLWSSQLKKTGESNELLTTLTLAAEGDTYMCGGGADGYQDEFVFQNFGVKLQYQAFQHPEYKQVNTQKFTSGLSVIDAAMNLGWSGISVLLRTGSNASI